MITHFLDLIPLDLFSKNSTACLKNLYTLLKRADSIQPPVTTKSFHLANPPIPKKERNDYFPQHIQKYVRSMSQKYEEVIIDLGYRKITIKFIYMKDTDYSGFKLSKYLPYLRLWFALVSMICPTKWCNQTLDIYIYLTKFKKEMPSKGKEITANEINSAYTFVCQKNGRIVIYREEEWFKVLIHETIHSFCLDFSQSSETKMRECLHGEFQFLVENALYCESYTETWAEILNCAIISYVDSGGGFNDFSLYFNFYIQVEIIHSIFQANKILSHYGYSFSSLREKRTPWNQSTHIYEYHIVKTMLLVSYSKFLNWCAHYNGKALVPFKRGASLVPFCSLIKESYKNETLFKKAQRLESRDNGNSLRMSICEI
jgi:hypothetical protein